MAGSWGVVTRQCTNQYCFTAKLTIGDGSTATWIKTTNERIDFNVSGYLQLVIKSNAHFIAGHATNLEDGSTLAEWGSDASGWQENKSFIYVYSGGYLNLYNSRILFLNVRHNLAFMEGSYITLKEVYIQGFDQIRERTVNFVLDDVRFKNSGTFSIIADIATPMQKPTMTRCNGFYVSGSVSPATYKIYDAILFNNTYDAYLYASHIQKFINPTWSRNIYDDGSGTIEEIFTFDLKIIDKDNNIINGATVKIWDKDSNLIVDTTTNASGVITQQEIKYKDWIHGRSPLEKTFSPHLITIEKAGYTTYEADFTLEDKTDWLVALQVGGGGVASKNINLSKRCRIK